MKKNRILQKIIGGILIVLSIVVQAKGAGFVFNGATILAINIAMSGIVLLLFDVKDIKKWIETEFFSFEEGIDVIPWLDPSEYDGPKKEGIIIQFRKSDK